VRERDPHDVLGVEPGASQAAIKAAWRRLAREHHPDLTGDDPVAARRATRRMAEINAAYERLRAERAGRAKGDGAGTDGHRSGPDGRAAGRRRPAGPPPPPPTRPVTGRLDTSRTFRPRNTTIPPGGPRPAVRPAWVPPLTVRGGPEELRASAPTGPLERAALADLRPRRPTLAEALAHPVDFGKYRGCTLGEIAGREPSYVDWIARTIGHDPDLVAAARVVAADLDRRGVPRRRRVSMPPPAVEAP
jgi:hypothetical protein